MACCEPPIPTLIPTNATTASIGAQQHLHTTRLLRTRARSTDRLSALGPALVEHRLVAGQSGLAGLGLWRLRRLRRVAERHDRADVPVARQAEQPGHRLADVGADPGDPGAEAEHPGGDQ